MKILPTVMPTAKPSRHDSLTALLQSLKPAQRAILIVGQLFVIAGICAGILVTDVNRIRHQATGDFEHFYFAAVAVYQGLDPYTAHTRGYIYPPLIAFLFQPLARFSWEQAAGIMLVVNVAVTLLAVALAVNEFLRRFAVPRGWLMTTTFMIPALLLNIDKIKGEWQMWQTDVWMLLLFVVALRWIDRLPFWAGIALGIAINIKYIPLIFLPYLLIRRRWRASIGLVAGTMLFALLPAISTGWNANLRNWGTATNGLLQMTGVSTGKAEEAAEVHDVRDSLSCSITSAMARTSGSHPAVGFFLAALTALILFGVAWAMYRQRRIPMFYRISPASMPVLTAVEWVMLIAIVLAFAPQTNTRHLFDALIFTSAASVFLVFARPVNRWPLVVGTLILFFGFILPPGSRTFRGERTPAILWLRMAGPCWCLVIAAFTLLWTGLHSKSPATAEANDMV
jgi:hypothetical protein